MARKSQSWDFTLRQVRVRQRQFHEFEWDTISILDNAVITIKPEKLLENVVGLRGQLIKEPNYVLVVPLREGPALKLGLGSRDGKIAPEFVYGVRYRQEMGAMSIRVNAHEMTKELSLQFKNRNDQDQVLRLFHDLGIRIESLRGSTRQPASQQPFRSSSVASSYQTPSANHPFTSRRSVTPLRQHYPERLGSSLSNHIIPDERFPSSQARNVLEIEHQPRNSTRHRDGTPLHSSFPMEDSHTYERAHTAFTERQGMGAHSMSSQERQYAPALQSTINAHHRPPQTFSTSVIDVGGGFSPLTEGSLLDEIDQSRLRPSSGAALRDMLPPRRELPFLSGKQAEPSVRNRSQEQLKLSDQGHDSVEAGQGKERLQQPTPQTISKPRLSTKQAEKPPHKRLLIVKRKDCDTVSNLVTKKQKPNPCTKPVSTSPIPLPTIPSATFSRKAIVRQPDVPSTPSNQTPNTVVQNFNEEVESEGLVAASSSNATYRTETIPAKGLKEADAIDAPAADTSSTSSEADKSEAESYMNSTLAMTELEKSSVIPDGSNVLPRPTSTKIDQGIQTLPISPDTSAKDEDLLVAKFKLMWDIRNLQQACFQRLLTDTGTPHHMKETKALEELEQNIIDLCQVAINQHGLSICDIPYEKLVDAIIRP